MAGSSTDATMQPANASDSYQCNMCQVELINKNTGIGQMYVPVANTHDLLSMRQVMHGAFHHSERLQHAVPICYCCRFWMMTKAFHETHTQPVQQHIETDYLYGIQRNQKKWCQQHCHWPHQHWWMEMDVFICRSIFKLDWKWSCLRIMEGSIEAGVHMCRCLWCSFSFDVHRSLLWLAMLIIFLDPLHVTECFDQPLIPFFFRFLVCLYLFSVCFSSV